MAGYIEVALAAFAYMLIGMVWYSKPVFGKRWMRLVKMKSMRMEAKDMVAAFLAALVLAYILAFFLKSVPSIIHALTTAAAIWIGFIATVTLNPVLWEKRPFALYLLNNAATLVQICAMAAIVYYI
jgi:hypothetical protein